MKKKLIIFITLSIFSMGFNNCFAQTDYATIIANVTAIFKAEANVSSLNNIANTNMSAQNSDGSWPDILYAAGAKGDVPFGTHLSRIFQYSLAYTLTGGVHYKDINLYNKISLALEYWNANIHKAANWWYNDISYPQLIGQTLIIMRGGDKPLSIADSTATMNYLVNNGHIEKQTGANLIDVCLHWLYRGALTNNATIIKTAVAKAGLTLNLVSSVTGEGICSDYAYIFHTHELMTQSYGNVLMADVYHMKLFLKGTCYVFTDAQLQTAYTFLHNSYNGATRGKWADFNLLGRGLSRLGSIIPAAITLDAISTETNSARLTELNNDYHRLSGKQPVSYEIAKPYHQHCWTGDYTLHNSPVFSFSVRSVSTRTARSESINGENLLGTFLTEGATCIRVLGNEYENIFPVWDWNLVPGVTMRQFATQQTNPTSCCNGNSSVNNGNQTFVGGVSDNTYGCSANYMNYFNVTAKKAWFFFANEVVCLGAGITSTSSENVATCVNQCLLNGDVSVGSSSSISTLATHTQTAYTGNLKWALQGSVGYFFPKGGNITVSNQAQTGSWSNINKSGSSTIVNKDVFKIWVNHGTSPTNAFYSYIVVPGISTTAQMSAYNQSNIKIIANTVSIQVVKNDSLNIIQAIVRATDGGTITDPTSGLKITVDQPCAVMVKNIGTTSVTVSIADPTQSVATINIGVTFPGKNIAIQSAVTMPAGNYKGASKTVIVSDGSNSSIIIKTVIFKQFSGGDLLARCENLNERRKRNQSCSSSNKLTNH